MLGRVRSTRSLAGEVRSHTVAYGLCKKQTPQPGRGLSSARALKCLRHWHGLIRNAPDVFV